MNKSVIGLHRSSPDGESGRHYIEETMTMETTAGVVSGAEAFVETLNELGVDSIFLNPGIDQVPLMAAIAKRKASQKQAPRVVLCTHESVAVAAAHGSAMVSGRPQVVAVFEDVGTLQGGGAIVNLKYGRIPVLLCAGANSTPNRLDWRQEPADQRKVLRDYVKWDHEVTKGEDIGSVLKEAFRVASAEPAGPVYVTIAQGVMAGEVGTKVVAAPSGPNRHSSPEAITGALRRATEMLIGSENPLIMAAYSGRHPESVASLVHLAEMLGARVITTDLRMNFPSTHPLCPGIDAIKGDSYDHYIAEADVLLLVDYNFPGPMAKTTRPRQDARTIQVDMEPLKNGAPLWNRPADVLIEGDSRELLPRLNALVAELAGGAERPRFDERFTRIAEEHKGIKEEWAAKALSEAGKKPISTEWLCRCINEVIDDDAIVVHMIPSSADGVAHQIRRTKPGTMFSWGENAGSMGWPLGAALGAKLAAPDSMVVSLIGDGGFIYGCPVATLWGAMAHNAPFLTVIFNNRSYAVFRDVMHRFYGDDILPGDMGSEVGIDFRNPPDFAAVARACGAYGQSVDDPAQIMDVLKTAIGHVRTGKAAVVDVSI